MHLIDVVVWVQADVVEAERRGTESVILDVLHKVTVAHATMLATHQGGLHASKDRQYHLRLRRRA